MKRQYDHSNLFLQCLRQPFEYLKDEMGTNLCINTELFNHTFKNTKGPDEISCEVSLKALATTIGVAIMPIRTHHIS